MLFTSSSCKKENKIVESKLAVSPLPLPLPLPPEESVIEQESFNMIYDEAIHSAFTDLIQWNNHFYITFRISDSHLNGANGVIIVMESVDGEKWNLIRKFFIEGLDLRDSKFIINADNDLLINTQGVVKFPSDMTNVTFLVYKATNFISDQNNTLYNGELMVKTPLKSWPWRFTYYKGLYYSWAYNSNYKDFKLISSKDFKEQKVECKVDSLTNLPSEGTIKVKNDTMFTVLRRNTEAMLGKASMSKLNETKWTRLPLINFGGPNFIFYNDTQIILAGRDVIDGGYQGYMSIYLYDIEKKKILYKLRLPSGGDCSYPGIIRVGNQLWISYYSSHEVKSKIYFAKVNIMSFLSDKNITK